MKTKNQSDGLTEANCSRQMGRYMRIICRRIVLSFYTRDDEGTGLALLGQTVKKLFWLLCQNGP